MMETPLLVGSMFERAERYFPKKSIISRTHDGIKRFTYKETGARIRALGSGLAKLNVEKGDKVATLAWNHHRHLEAYFAIPSLGAVLHTINIRLSSEHLTYIINHAEDKVLLIDEDLLPLVETIKDQLTTVEAFIIMTGKDDLPESSLAPLYHYESLLEDGDDAYTFTSAIDENDPAGLCYTSATTGKPKGIVYSHRGIVLHSMALGMADTAAMSENDIVMPVVPMFHVNAWGMPFVATWLGSTQVLPGPLPAPNVLAELIESYKVNKAAGVPTIWLGLLNELEQHTYDVSSLDYVLSGGAAAPKGMIKAFEQKHGIPFAHAYGLTETTPLVTLSRIKSYQKNLDEEAHLNIKAKQGMVVPGLDIKVVNDTGEVEPDGEDMGELLVKGPWIADEYHNDERTRDAFYDGWFHTGDVATIDGEGNIKIVDRTKDLIKSGGEWISSVDLENALMAHEDVYEAAVVSVPHPKWQERPVACVVLQEEAPVTKDDLMAFLEPQFAKFWLPDDILFMEAIPKTSVGKFLKRALREQVEDTLEI